MVNLDSIKTFNDIKHLLKKEADTMGSVLEDEVLSEYAPYGLSVYDIDYTLRDLLYNRFNVYIGNQWYCTDSYVGKMYYEFDGDLCFSTYQPYRKSSQSLTIHNEGLFDKFIKSFRECFTPPQYHASKNIEKFDINSIKRNIVFVYDYGKEDLIKKLCLNDDGYICECLNVSSLGLGYFEQKIEYVDIDGSHKTYIGDSGCRMVGSTFDITIDEVKGYLLGKNIFTDFGRYVYNQHGQIISDKGEDLK